MSEQHPHAHGLLNEWRDILARPIASIIETTNDPSVHARDLKQVTPFAGVISAAERTAAYAQFANEERRR